MFLSRNENILIGNLLGRCSKKKKGLIEGIDEAFANDKQITSCPIFESQNEHLDCSCNPEVTRICSPAFDQFEIAHLLTIK